MSVIIASQQSARCNLQAVLGTTAWTHEAVRT